MWDQQSCVGPSHEPDRRLSKSEALGSENKFLEAGSVSSREMRPKSRTGVRSDPRNRNWKVPVQARRIAASRPAAGARRDQKDAPPVCTTCARQTSGEQQSSKEVLRSLPHPAANPLVTVSHNLNRLSHRDAEARPVITSHHSGDICR